MTEAIYTTTVYPAYSTDQIKQMEYDLGVYKSTIEDLQKSLQNALDTNSSLTKLLNEKKDMISAVESYIKEAYEIDDFSKDRMDEIANALNIELTKRISGTASFEISWSADVPMDFEPNDFEISFDVDCDTYEADNFDWQVEEHDINAEED